MRAIYFQGKFPLIGYVINDYWHEQNSHIVKDATLKVDEKELADYVATIKEAASKEGANSFYAKEENIYKVLGAGNLEEGKAYFLNQDAVRNYVIENYK